MRPKQNPLCLPEHHRQILVWLAQGMSFKEIAAHTHMSNHTVVSTVLRLRRRFRAKNTTQLIVHALASGVIALNICVAEPV